MQTIITLNLHRLNTVRSKLNKKRNTKNQKIVIERERKCMLTFFISFYVLFSIYFEYTFVFSTLNNLYLIYELIISTINIGSKPKF